MSISTAMLSGLSGLKANSVAMSALSDNIVNVNTVGFKQNLTDFLDQVTARAPDGQYNSGGVTAKVHQLISEQGQMMQTSSATDLGIVGSGFFIGTEKPNGVASTDARTFTRAGSFAVDNQGYLKNAAGLYLQGWLPDSTGAIASDPSDISKLGSINVNAGNGAPTATTSVSAVANLNAAQAVSPQEATYASGDMAAYAPATATGVRPDYSIQMPIYDSKGGKHTVQLDLLKSVTSNQWHAEVHAIPASDIDGATNGLLASGVLAFTQDGKLDPTATSLPSSLTIGASGSTGVAWAAGLGISGQSVAVNLGGTAGGVTQFAQASGTSSITTDGGPVGQLSGVSVNDRGEVIAAYDNGTIRRLAQIALGTFPNPDGLTAVSGREYRASQNSGGYTLKVPKADGAGGISPSSLEGSTVDLSAQFTNLITTQKAYSASAKIITAADQLLQDTLDMKR